MYLNVVLLTILCGSVHSANYQRFGDTNNQYSTYSSYSTVANPYSQYPYKSGSNYGSDIANFPGVTRYPNYSPGYSTSKYDAYTSQRSNVFYPPGGYSTQRYGDTYSQGYGQGLGGSQGYGQGLGYGQGTGYGTGYNSGYGNSYSSYEMPFMNNMRDYCVNRSPQTAIWVDSLMGMWYGVEFIQHLAGDARVDYARTCIVVHISEPVDQVSTFWLFRDIYIPNGKVFKNSI